MKKINVGLLFGGRSGEHEVSLNSASNIAKALDSEKYNVIPIAIAKDGKWYAPIEIDDIKIFTPEKYQGYEVTILPHPNENKLIKLSDYTSLINIDIVFPIIHGTYGEDGTLQGLLDMANIPYVGAGVLGSAVGMDKIIMKKVLAYHNLPQVNFCHTTRNAIKKDLPKVINQIIKKLVFPLFVKPANLGSSVGVSKVKNIKELENALYEACKYDRKVIIEEGVDAREVEISILGNDEPIVSIPGEIIPCNEFYDYKAKYVDNKSILEIPAKLDDETIKQIQKLAIDAFKALDCEGLARMDFFLCKKTNKIYINEINTLPGFTAISMYPKLWEYSGLNVENLLDRLITLAFARHNERNQNITNYNNT